MSVSLDSIRVLHVDDDPDLASLVAMYLEREDERIDVRTATSASAGLDVLRGESVDCVVSDYDMPGTDGIEFLDAVREDHPDLPFILFTGKGSEEIASAAISAGVTDYLQKETGTDQYAILANRIENAVEHDRSQRALAERKRRLETLISNLPGVVYRCRNEQGWPMEYVEGECERLVGYPAAVIESGEVSWGENVVHPDDQEGLWETVQNALDDGDPFEVTYRVRTAGDEVRWLWERGRGVFADGDLVALEGFITDVTDRKRRETKLEATTARLEALFDHSPDMIDVHDAEGTIRNVNRRLCEELGYDEGDLLGRKVWEIDDAIDEGDARQLWAGMETGDRLRVDGHYRRADGSTFPVEVHIVRFELGGEDRFLVVSRDVSERVAYEQQLHETNRQLEGVLDTVSAGIFMKEPDGQYTILNETAREWLGVDPERPVADLSDVELFSPDVVDRIREEDRRAFATGETIEVRERLSRGEGERLIRSQKHPLYDEDGEPDAICGVVTDVTERERRRGELRKYESMINAMRDAACIYDAEGRFEVVNDYLASFYGTTAAELVGRESGLVEAIREESEGDPFAELVAGDREELRGVREGEFPGHGHAVVDYRLTRLTVQGAFAGVVAVAREISDQRERERELERQNERLDEFVSVVSHDLRNPLTVANGHLELVREECDSDHVDAVARAHDRMEALVDDLLALAREGEDAVEIEPLGLGDLSEDCWRNVAANGAELVVDTDATVYADRSRLARLLENLFGNAAEHGTDDGDGDAAEARVTVTVGDTDDGFYVADDGVGIPPEEREQVFESGYSTSLDGTGFGLRIVAQIADSHGWTVDVTESEAGGARFEFGEVRRG